MWFFRNDRIFVTMSRVVFFALVVLSYQQLHITAENAVKTPTAKQQTTQSADVIHVLMRMSRLVENEPLKRQRYEENLEGLLAYSTAPLHLHLILPKDSFELANEIIAKVNDTVKVDLEITKYDFSDFAHQLSSMAKMDFGQDPDFSKMLGNRMPTLLLPFLFPHLKRLVVAEDRITIRADIAELYAHFRHFNNEQLIGVALQQAPKYRHSFSMYEKYNPASGLGHPARPGFNTALMLLDLQKMRHSITLNAFLHYPSLRWLVHKYWFTKDNNPVISQEDVFTLMGFEHPELFYILPCGWNRQMDLIGFSQSEARDYNQCDGKVYAENLQDYN